MIKDRRNVDVIDIDNKENKLGNTMAKPVTTLIDELYDWTGSITLRTRRTAFKRT